MHSPLPFKCANDGYDIQLLGDESSSVQVDGEDTSQDEVMKADVDLLYGLEERPPWHLWILLSLQQFLLAATSQILNPLIIAGPLCLAGDVEGMGEFVGSVFFVGGIASILQTTLGIRLPIIQGPSSAFIAPIISLMRNHESKCPDFNQAGNITLPFEAGSDTHKGLWKSNLTELQGALMVAALVEVLLGFTGAIGVLMRFIGPLTTSSVLMLIGLSVCESATFKGSTQWWICILSVFLIILFSQYLRNVNVPFFGGHKLRIFLLFPVLLGICISWLVCFFLTVSGALPDEPGEWGYEARTDTKLGAVGNAAWFRFPYPGQWGTPTVSVGGVVAMIAAIFASTIESIGDYHACARLCKVPPPTGSALSRGIGMEGICCILGGAWGTGSGFTSYSANVATIGLTRVGSRVVIQMAAVMLLVVGCLGKFGTFFSTVPEPIVGGMIYVMFGMVTAIGISSLASVDLNSMRNLFVFGFAVFFGVSIPSWVVKNPFHFDSQTVNEVLNVILSTSMLVGGIIAFVLDNTIPGTLEERGIRVQGGGDHGDSASTDVSGYDLPLIQPYIDRVKWFRYVPFCPGFVRDGPASRRRDDDSDDGSEDLDQLKLDVEMEAKPVANSHTTS